MTYIRPRVFAVITAAGLFLCLRPAFADPTTYCVSCSEPAKTYRCAVATPRENISDRAKRLYCIVKTAKDGNHKTCSIRRGNAPCDGPLREYSYDGPAIPDSVRSAVESIRNERIADRPPGTEAGPQQKGGEPDTLVEMTSRAVGASKRGLRSAGETVVDVAGGTGRTIGAIGKTAGKQVGKTARGAKGAFRYAYDCVLSLFRRCGQDDPAAGQDQQ